MLPQLRSDPIGVFLEAADRYGDLVHLKAGPYHGYLVSNPRDIKHVLQDNYRNYHKSPLYERLEDGIGKGLLTSEDSFWLRQRRLAQPAFHRQRIALVADAMVGAAHDMLDRWEGFASRGEAIDVPRAGGGNRQPHVAGDQQAHRRNVLGDETRDAASAARESALPPRARRARNGGLPDHRRAAAVRQK
jgi:hypothetical protein